MLGEKIPRGIPFWIEDKSLSFLLGFLVFMIILVPTVRLSRSGRIAIDLVFALIFLSGCGRDYSSENFGRQPEETAPRPHRRVPVACTRSGGAVRGIA